MLSSGQWERYVSFPLGSRLTSGWIDALPPSVAHWFLAANSHSGIGQFEAWGERANQAEYRQAAIAADLSAAENLVTVLVYLWFPVPYRL